MSAEATRNDAVPAAHRRAALVFLLITLVAVSAIRVRLAPIPLERDEGEYAYAGQLVLQGIPPFVELYNMKMPGIYWAYAAMMFVFGQTSLGIHYGLLCMNAATVLLGYRLARRVFDPVSASITASTYAWLSLGIGVQGFFAHAEHFVVFFVILGLLCLPANHRWIAARIFLSGALLGAAIACAQTLLYHWQTFLSRNLYDISRSIYGAHPFVESLEIARYLRERTTPDDRIAILGSEPQILFYAQRRSATPFVYMYPLFELQPAAARMQREMIDGIAQTRPKYVVVVNVRPSWLLRPNSVMAVMHWYPGFLKEHYRRVGAIDLNRTVANTTWGEDLGERAQFELGTVNIYARNGPDGESLNGFDREAGHEYTCMPLQALQRQLLLSATPSSSPA